MFVCALSFRFRKADLIHNEQCTAEAKKAAQAGTCVALDVLQNECDDEMRQWTLSGVGKAEMFRRLEARYYPLKLGDDGKRKVTRVAVVVSYALRSRTNVL